MTLDLPDLPEPAIGRVVSLPDHGPNLLNRLHLRLGRLPEPGTEREVVIGDAFADAQGFRPGDVLNAVIHGRWDRLRIVGVALSPEFIYSIREGELLPDNRRFGVLWTREQELSRAFDLEGAFNDLCLTLEPGASEEEVLRRLDLLTAPYGGIGAYGRRDQTSAKFLDNELIQLRGMGLDRAVHLSDSRRVSDEHHSGPACRRAAGTDRDAQGVRVFPMGIGSALPEAGAAGGVRGKPAGCGGRGLAGLEHDAGLRAVFPLPRVLLSARMDAPFWAVVVSAGTSLAGTLQAAARAGRLPPAEAMRPEPPARYRRLWTENSIVSWLLSPVTRMIVRHLQRRPLKTLFTSLGISLAVAVYVLGAFLQDAVEYVIEFQFERTQQYDVAVTFREPTTGGLCTTWLTCLGFCVSNPFAQWRCVCDTKVAIVDSAFLACRPIGGCSTSLTHPGIRPSYPTKAC